jgi:hypothetical protein
MATARLSVQLDKSRGNVSALSYGASLLCFRCANNRQNLFVIVGWAIQAKVTLNTGMIFKELKNLRWNYFSRIDDELRCVFREPAVLMTATP